VKTLRLGNVDLLKQPLIIPAPNTAEMVIEVDRIRPQERAPFTPLLPKSRASAPNPLNGIGMEFVQIEPGTFQMGCSTDDNECSDGEKPAHIVRLTKGFEIGKYEVTQAQWRTVMETSPSYFKGDSLPVEQVTWSEVEEFITRMNERNDGYRYRLPTEAEWEYAARAGSTGSYEAEPGWHRDSSNGQTHPVGQKPPNAWGIHDMLGNVREWVHDRPGPYTSGLVTDPQGERTGGRIVRGGSWDAMARDLRFSSRGFSSASFLSPAIGFRCVREPIQ
jgi:formylglycine-generating enzyme required for sulfatase activity